MDDHRVGRSLRVLRQRRGLRQADIAARSGTCQSLISDIEAGRIERVPYGVLRRVFGAVDAGFGGVVQWRGAALDRLLDARHAGIASAATIFLDRHAWEPHPEVSYSVYGERGSIDILAVRPEARVALVTEVKASSRAWRGRSASSTRRCDSRRSGS